MIFDQLDNSIIYQSLGGGIAAGLAAMKGSLNPHLHAIADGRHAIDGDRLFAIVQTYQSKPRDQGEWEAHQRYIDIQYIVEGAERMGIAPVALLTPRAPYDAEKDIIFFDAPPAAAGQPMPEQFITVGAGSLTIFFPHDAHMPSLAVDEPRPVRKIVVKVALETMSRRL